MNLATDRSMVVLTGVAAAVLLSACGEVGAPDGPGDAGTGPANGATADPAAPTTSDPATPTTSEPGAELVGSAMLLQSASDAPVELCLGGVLTSYPPQCGGPRVEGDFSWTDVGSETAAGVTWTTGEAWVVGHYDPQDGDTGSFTLSRPVREEPPDGFTPPAAQDLQFPQLCDDPLADVSDVDQAARTRGPEGMDQEQALVELLHQGGLEGYATSWVSDGGPTFNVVVTADPVEARASIREVFQGPLCVERRDVPSQEEVSAAQQSLHAHEPGLGLLGSGGGGVSGLLEVQVVLADEATVRAVHEIVAEWLTPEQVLVSGALEPLGGG